jgi:hypothetical protein
MSAVELLLLLLPLAAALAVCSAVSGGAIAGD